MSVSWLGDCFFIKQCGQEITISNEEIFKIGIDMLAAKHSYINAEMKGFISRRFIIVR
jgi:hypothetical protein